MALAAKKKAFISPRFALPIAAVVVLILSFVTYYFVIITRSESSLDDRAFRSLSAVSLQLRDGVNTYGTVFQGAAKEEGVPQKKKKHKATQSPHVLSFLAAQGSNLADVDNCESSPNAKILLSAHGKARTTAAAVPRSNGYSLELASNGWCAHVARSRLRGDR